MQKLSNEIEILLLTSAAIILIMAVLIFTITYLHRKKGISHIKKLKQIEENYEKEILNSKLEIQEYTFQHISREIHDNINLSLTLAKLNLNTISPESPELILSRINESIELITQSIANLNDLSKGLDSDFITQEGLILTLKSEITRIQKSSGLDVSFNIAGNPVFMDSKSETLIFRIVQEAFNNVLKHAKASRVRLLLCYRNQALGIRIHDNGKGFLPAELNRNGHAGLRNMKARSTLLNGRMELQSRPGHGTRLDFLIPIKPM